MPVSSDFGKSYESIWIYSQNLNLLPILMPLSSEIDFATGHFPHGRFIPWSIHSQTDYSPGAPKGSPREQKVRPLSAVLLPGTSKSSFYACFSTNFGWICATPKRNWFCHGQFSGIWPENRIFRNLTDSRSSGMQNAQNFAAIVSSMVLGPSVFFLTFSHVSHFLFFQCFSIFWGGGGGVFPNLGLGVGGCFPINKT